MFMLNLFPLPLLQVYPSVGHNLHPVLAHLMRTIQVFYQHCHHKKEDRDQAGVDWEQWIP